MATLGRNEAPFGASASPLICDIEIGVSAVPEITADVPREAAVIQRRGLGRLLALWDITQTSATRHTSRCILLIIVFPIHHPNGAILNVGQF